MAMIIREEGGLTTSNDDLPPKVRKVLIQMIISVTDDAGIYRSGIIIPLPANDDTAKNPNVIKDKGIAILDA
jgi:hypothetical protein